MITKNVNPLAISLLALGFASLANAQASRTWVSGVGDDANPCSRTAPCKTFAGAISKTAVGGEIDALDPGGFGAVTITKAFTIDGGGGQVASVLVSGTHGIIVSIGATDVVTLRNLRLQGLGTGLDAIHFVGGGTLHVENCNISNFQRGIETEGTPNHLTVVNTTITDSSQAGIFLSTASTAGLMRADISNTRIFNTQIGVRALDGIRAVVSDCEISHTFTAGVQASIITSRPPIVTVVGSTLEGNITALQSTNGTLTASGNSFVDNSTVYSLTAPGQIFTGGDNVNGDNTTVGTTSGTSTKI
jgi:hypothetical protein